jgi:hypothetical protein
MYQRPSMEWSSGAHTLPRFQPVSGADHTAIGGAVITPMSVGDVAMQMRLLRELM